MFALGTLINSGSVILGGLFGYFVGVRFQKRQQEALTKACGISVLFIAIAGAMSGMLRMEDGVLISQNSMMVVLCVVLGTLIGELLNIELGFEKFGEWLKQKTGNGGDNRFVDAFVTSSLTVCIGAMAIVGAIQDGMTGDYTTLAIKSVLDFVIVAVLTSSLGKGAAFAAIPVFLLEGGVTLLARLIAPLMTQAAIDCMSMVGAVLIFCVGVNLVWGKKISVANMLPAVALAVAAAYFPWSL